MANPNPDQSGLEKGKWKPGQSGNPKGKPKGTKHISTWIQELLNDEDFTLDNFMFNGKQFKGAPLKAIITVAIMNSLQGDNKWAEWLAKHGYGNNVNLNINRDPVDEILKKFGIEGVGSAGQTEADASKSPQDNS